MEDWRDKDDLDLTSEDISAMFEAGDPVEVRGPSRLPAGGAFVGVACTFGGSHWLERGLVLTGPRLVTIHRYRVW